MKNEHSTISDSNYFICIKSQDTVDMYSCLNFYG